MTTLRLFLIFLFGIAHFMSSQDKPEKNIQPTIPLDQNDPTLDIWKTFRDDLQGDREPGLINVQRLHGGPGYMGMPTFFQTPVALTPADLKAGDVIYLDYIPSTGTQVTFNGEKKPVIEGADFYAALLDVWLGEEPADDDLKDALLGLAED